MMEGRPTPYESWQAAAEALLDPLIPLMVPGATETALDPWASDHDANADRLEAFARPCFLAALWLQSKPPEGGLEKRQKVAAWFRQALVRGSNPQDPGYWGPNTNYHQNGVEIGLLVCGLLLARDHLWEPLTEEEKTRIGRWVASNRATGHHWNNHMFFGVLALEFLAEIGMERPADERAIEHWFTEMEGMYRGGGWFMDGMNQSYDHYNAYAFHFYGLLWSHLFGAKNPQRRERWCGWASTFLEEYQYAFAASGEHPAFGRSITYRFNASAPFSLACLLGVSPLTAGRARRLCTRNLRFFLDRPITQSQGALSLGWHDPFPQLAEGYSCAGSPYWAAKAFVTLLLPPEHPFWTEAEESLPVEEGDFVRPQPAAGLVFRGIGGEVEWLNAGSEITPVNMPKFGPWKWGKLAYRTGIGFQVGRQDGYYGKVNGYYSRDGGLTLEGGGDDRIHGRHYTLPLEMDERHLWCTYALGDKLDQLVCVVETGIWWRAGWLFQFHWTEAYQPVRLTLGGYSLSSGSAEILVRSEPAPSVLRVDAGEQCSVLQALQGFEIVDWDLRLDEQSPRAHVCAPFHAAPLASTARAAGKRGLAALTYAGPDGEAAQTWDVLESSPRGWRLRHPLLGDWEIAGNGLC
ncbi:MAG: DUF2264 domain-containing protein [Oceanipulchritudo sp.]